MFLPTVIMDHVITFKFAMLVSFFKNVTLQAFLSTHTKYFIAFFNMFSSFSTRDRLRRTMSNRSMRKPRPATEAESIDPEIAKLHAAAAASRAMRSNGRSSMDSKKSYDRLGGPGNVAIPRRRPGSSLRTSEDSYSNTAPIAPPATPQSYRSNVAAHTHCRDDSAVLPPITEFKGLDGRDCSAPSSYRRLRKAKSMFSTRQRLSHIVNGTPPMPHGSSPGPDISPEFALPRTLRNSASFMRGSRQGPSSVRHAKSQDAAIQLARDRYLEDIGESNVQSRRPSWLLSRRKRDHKPFRKSFRTTSDGGVEASPSSSHFTSRLSHNGSRTFSSSIKHGLKRVFGLSKPAEQPHEPQSEDQCLEDIVATPDDSDIEKADIDETHDIILPQHSPSRASMSSSNSRLASRATSSVADTVTTRRTGHRQSLSLIEEHGVPDGEPFQVPTYGTESRQSPSRKRSSGNSHSAWFNTQDLYTALMQQISRKSAQTLGEEVTLGTVPEYHAIPERAPSVQSYRSKRTIRRVPSTESSGSPGSFATARGDSLSPLKSQRSGTSYVRPLRFSHLRPDQGTSRPSAAYSGRKAEYSAYTMDTDSDGETGSVIVERSRPNARSDSPTSMYSRTVSGNTPTNDADCQVSGFDVEDTGTATIFASERTAWSSPNRRSESRTSMPSVQPSGDWQEWMSSQIERIEQTSPAREHVREGAQYQDEDERFTHIFQQAHVPDHALANPVSGSDGQDDISNPPLRVQALAQNNFSRPFSRTSSIRTILSVQKVECLEPKNATASNSENEVTSSLQALQPWPTQALDSPPSPMRIRSSNVGHIPESPTPSRGNSAKAPKRTWTQEQYKRYSARRSLYAGPNSFRSMRSQQGFSGFNNENTRQGQEHEDMMSDYHTLQDENSTMSSKRMVDMFLDNRRRQMGMEPAEGERHVNAAGQAFI